MLSGWVESRRARCGVVIERYRRQGALLCGGHCQRQWVYSDMKESERRSAADTGR